VCMHVYMYVCMHVCPCVRMCIRCTYVIRSCVRGKNVRCANVSRERCQRHDACITLCMHLYRYVCVCGCVHVFMRVRVCGCVVERVCCVCVRICACVYHTYTHTFIKYTHVCNLLSLDCMTV